MTIFVKIHMHMLSKQKVLKTVSELPDSFSLDELIDKLIFIEKIQKGMEDSLAEKINSKEEAAKRLAKWLE
jgi:hypothetical protein